MHELLVQHLPRECRLTGIFDVRQIHINLSISTLKSTLSAVIPGLSLVRPSPILVIR
jgi:hypothetical protein